MNTRITVPIIASGISALLIINSFRHDILESLVINHRSLEHYILPGVMVFFFAMSSFLLIKRKILHSLDSRRAESCIIYRLDFVPTASSSDIARELLFLNNFIKSRSRPDINEYYMVIFGYQNKQSIALLLVCEREDICRNEENIVLSMSDAFFRSIKLERKIVVRQPDVLKGLKNILLAHGRHKVVKDWFNPSYIRELVESMSSQNISDEYNAVSNETIFIPIGINVATDDAEGIFSHQILRHMVIAGSTGSGKSTTTALLISNILKLDDNVSVLILDWNGEYRYLLEKHVNEDFREKIILIRANKININTLVFKNRDLHRIVEVFERAFDLSIPQSYILYKTISSNTIHSLNSLLEHLAMVAQDSYWDREIRSALLRKIEPLSSIFRSSVVELDKYYNKQGVIVVDLSVIPNTRLKAFLALLIIADLISKARTGVLNKISVVVLEEVHNLLRVNEDLISDALAEMRKFNVGFILITQSFVALSQRILSNINTFIIHSLRSSHDKKYVLESLPIPNDKREYFGNLLHNISIGMALFYAPHLREPVVVKIPKKQ